MFHFDFRWVRHWLSSPIFPKAKASHFYFSRVHLQIFSIVCNCSLKYLSSLFLSSSIFLFSHSLPLSPSCKDLSSKRVGVGGNRGWKQTGAWAGECQDLALLLVGCCLMDRRGRRELFSLFWRSRSTETIFTGKSKREGKKRSFFFKRECFSILIETILWSRNYSVRHFLESVSPHYLKKLAMSCSFSL